MTHDATANQETLLEKYLFTRVEAGMDGRSNVHELLFAKIGTWHLIAEEGKIARTVKPED